VQLQAAADPSQEHFAPMMEHFLGFNLRGRLKFAENRWHGNPFGYGHPERPV